MAGVFRNIDPPPPSPPGDCVQVYMSRLYNMQLQDQHFRFLKVLPASYKVQDLQNRSLRVSQASTVQEELTESNQNT
jgi:hypothetical protein